MTDRIGLETAFFNLVNGRRQDSSDTFRVQPSLRTHSGESIGFYAVSEATPIGPMGARARRLVLDVIQGEMASRFDLPLGSRLKHSVVVAQNELLTEFGGHVQVGVTVLISSGSSLYLLQVPPAQAYVLHAGTLHSVTPSAHEGDDEQVSLGSQRDPFVSLFRDSIEPGDVLALTGSWVDRSMDTDELRAAFAEDGPRKIVRELFEASRHLEAGDLTCLALQAFEEQEPSPLEPGRIADAPRPQTVWDYVDDAVGSLGWVLGRAREELDPQGSRRSGSVGAGAAREPVQTALVFDEPSDAFDQEPVLDDLPPASGASSEDMPWEHLTEELPVVPTAPAVEASAGEWQERRADAAMAEPVRSELDEVNSFIRRSGGMGDVTPPVQAFPDTAVSPERIYPGSRSGGLRGQYGRPDLDRQRTAPRRRRTRTAGGTGLNIPPAMIFWSAAGLALVVVLVVVVSLTLGGGPDYPGMAKSEAASAVTAFHANQPKLARTDLATAWGDVRKARKAHASASDVLAASTSVQQAADVIHLVFHPQASRITRFTAFRANPKEIVTGSIDLYVLDVARRHIWAVNPSQVHPVPSPAVGGFGNVNYNTGTTPQHTFGAPRQLTVYQNFAVAMDGHYTVLVNDPEPHSPVLTVQTLTIPSAKSTVEGIAMWEGNLYLLDTADGQIYRYNASGQPYQPFNSQPEARLVHSYAELKLGSSLAVAYNSIFVSTRDGRLLKFKLDPSSTLDEDSLTPFAVSLPIPFHHATQVYARNDLKIIFLVNSAAGKIVELTTKGGYIRTIAAPKSLVKHMHQITISNDGKTIYFLSGKGLYSMPVTP